MTHDPMLALSGTPLADIRAAADAAAAAQTNLRAAVQAAVDAGAAVSDVATAAGVTRQTIYRWADQGTATRLPVQETLGAALLVLADVIGPTNRPTVLARVHGSPEQQLRGLDIALKSLDVGGLESLDEEQRGVVATAQAVAAAARRQHASGGGWPSSVAV